MKHLIAEKACTEVNRELSVVFDEIIYCANDTALTKAVVCKEFRRLLRYHHNAAYVTHDIATNQGQTFVRYLSAYDFFGVRRKVWEDIDWFSNCFYFKLYAPLIARPVLWEEGNAMEDPQYPDYDSDESVESLQLAALSHPRLPFKRCGM